MTILYICIFVSFGLYNAKDLLYYFKVLNFIVVRISITDLQYITINFIERAAIMYTSLYICRCV